MVSEPNKTICGLSLGSTAVPANTKQSSQKKKFFLSQNSYSASDSQSWLYLEIICKTISNN